MKEKSLKRQRLGGKSFRSLRLAQHAIVDIDDNVLFEDRGFLGVGEFKRYIITETKLNAF